MKRLNLHDKDIYQDVKEVKPTHLENVRQIEEELKDAECKRNVRVR